VYQQLKIKFGYWLEHRIKYVGTFMSGTLTIIVGFLLLMSDYLINLNSYFNEQQVFERLTTVGMVLISVIVGISLTTFSVIFVVMQLASSQFSPRILRHFLANDVKIQQYIGLFIGTLSLCILPQAASAVYGGSPFLITLSVGLAMALRCVVWSYPRMITYMSINMNVAAIVDKIKDEVVEEINTLYNDEWLQGNNMLYLARRINPDKKAIMIPSPFKTGYLESVDYLRLEKLVTEFVDGRPWASGLLVFQRPVVGEYVMKGASPLLRIELETDTDAEQAAEIKAAFTSIAEKVFSVHTFRSYTQDINFGVRKLVDIAIKAISPAVNDPTTCLNCIDQLGDIAWNLQQKQYPSTQACKLRAKNIIVNEFNFDHLIDFCFDQIFQWGKEDPTIVRRLLQTLALLAENAQNPYVLMVLVRQVEDMDLSTIYNADTIAAHNIKISVEKLDGLMKELRGFNMIAKERIDYLQEKGMLEYIPAGEHPEIEAGEKAAIEYLLTYRSLDC